MAIHKFTRLIDEGKKIPMFGDGSSKRDYTYIDDIIDGVMKSLDKRHAFEIFNLGESETTELRKLISLIEKNLGKKAQIDEQPNQPGDVSITYADIEKAKSMLQYNPTTKIEKGIELFIKWYRETK